MKSASSILPLALAVLCAGCLSVKTEHKIDPIQITLDVNVKMDKELENAFGSEDSALKSKSARASSEAPSGDRQPPKRFFEVKALLDRQAAGIDNRGNIVPRGELTDDEKRLFLCDNAKQFFGFGELVDLPYIKNMSE